MALVQNIDGVPAYSTVEEALQWKKVEEVVYKKKMHSRSCKLTDAVQ